jgi:hypothetical protein
MMNTTWTEPRHQAEIEYLESSSDRMLCIRRASGWYGKEGIRSKPYVQGPPPRARSAFKVQQWNFDEPRWRNL